MHSTTALIAALAAVSLPQSQAKPIEARQLGGLGAAIGGTVDSAAGSGNTGGTVGSVLDSTVSGTTDSAVDTLNNAVGAVQGFTLQQEEYGKRLKNGPIALGNLYKKFDVDMPDDVFDAFDVATQSQPPNELNKRAAAATSSVKTSTLSSSVKPTSSSIATTSAKVSSTTVAIATKPKPTGGSATATPVNQFDTAYMIAIKVGGNTVYVDLDTGSSDLWVFSNQQPSAQTQKHNIYSPSPSKLMQGYSWNVTYLDGSTAAGNVYNDTVTLGNMNFTGQAVEAAQYASDAFVAASYDGMLGLAFDNLNTVKPRPQRTLFNSISSQLPKPLFTSLLKHNAPGSYDFGYVDTTKYTGAITYANVSTANGWWQFTSQGYSIGSGAAVSQAVSAVVDTGTTLMVMPSNIVNAYYAKVAGAGYSSAYGAWVYPCASSMPNFNLIVNGAAQTIPGNLMTYGPIDYNGNCYGGLQANDNIGVAILGTIFIKSQYVIYDQSTNPPRVGFAKQAGLSYN
ncbi:Aspartic protease SNP2 [Lasiodiplodia hormozganensis]|uniref:Aspartic protease SNP2 n=1 Tax=Lasiodiplodia hormozganensis TaxID=869390 RepID=A0AA39Z070_9PEZI|nr:Aspartic protease SNP2 [Lasiodiplodia hormozganensis]